MRYHHPHYCPANDRHFTHMSMVTLYSADLLLVGAWARMCGNTALMACSAQRASMCQTHVAWRMSHVMQG